MPPMPGPPDPPIPPYHIFVTAVNDSGSSPVSGAQFTLKNTSKATQAPAIISNETNSNIILNVADCGAWTDSDNIELDVSYNSEGKTESTSIDLTSHPSGRELGTITLQVTSHDVSMTLAMSQGVADTASKTTDAALTLLHLAGTADGGQANTGAALIISELLTLAQNTDGSTEVGVSLSQVLALVQTTEGQESVAMTLSQTMAIVDSAQATTNAAVTLSQVVGVEDGSPLESELLLSAVQSVTFTATITIILGITPPGRTVYIKCESKTA